MAREDTIRQLVSEAESVLAKLREEVQFQERYIDTLKAKLTGDTDGAIKPVSKYMPRGGLNTSGTIAEMIVQLLNHGKKPMRVREIADKLEAAGVTTDAKKGLFPNVGSALSRREDLFVRQARGLYGLKEWAIEEAE